MSAIYDGSRCYFSAIGRYDNKNTVIFSAACCCWGPAGWTRPCCLVRFFFLSVPASESSNQQSYIYISLLHLKYLLSSINTIPWYIDTAKESKKDRLLCCFFCCCSCAVRTVSLQYFDCLVEGFWFVDLISFGALVWLIEVDQLIASFWSQVEVAFFFGGGWWTGWSDRCICQGDVVWWRREARGRLLVAFVRVRVWRGFRLI